MPLANDIRPTTFSDIVNQEHLVGDNGIITNMLKNKKLVSMILSGGPGTGKTTIASIIAKEYENTFFFNASTDKKVDLQKIEILDKPIVLVVDEIHRMKTDTQDYLLKFLENGQVIMIGLTTHNPYYKVNPAIRSRSILLKLNELNAKGIKTILKNAVNHTKFDKIVEDEALELIASSFSNEARSSLNFLEILLNMDTDITVNLVNSVQVNKNLKLDATDDYHYQLLSGLQKSIRGSDLDAALYYTAKLLLVGDTASLNRRLMIIAYEDISIANTDLCNFTVNAVNAADQVGYPESRIMYANIVTVLCLSPKSNFAEVSIDKALNFIQNNSTDYNLPIHLQNTKLYKYPHDYAYAMLKQDYLPSEIKDVRFVEFKGLSKNEQLYKEKYENIIKYIK